MLPPAPSPSSDPTRARSSLRRALALATALTLVCACTRSNRGGIPGAGDGAHADPVLVIAVDGLEWSVLAPLLRAGELPTLAALMDRGTWGSLRTFEPTLSPIIWTTIATGKPPGVHGIQGFVKPGRAGRKVELMTNLDRRTKALWNIASDYERRVGVVGWWMTFPVEEVNGVMVAQTNTRGQLDVSYGKRILKGRIVPDLPGQVHPPERAPEIFELLADVDASIGELVAERFGVDPATLTPLGRTLWDNCLWSLRADETYLRIATRLLAEDDYDLFLVYFGGPDVVGHRFWRYHAPEVYTHPPSAEEIERLGDVLRDEIRYLDRSIALLLEQVDADTNILVVSDHGMVPIATGARFDPAAPPRSVNSANHMDAPPGVIIAAGPAFEHPRDLPAANAIDPETLIEQASVRDLCVLVLELLHIPRGDDMHGRTNFPWLRFQGYDPKSVPSHDTLRWMLRHASQAGEHPDEGERLRQLHALGYVDDE